MALDEPPSKTDVSANHGPLQIGPVIATYVIAVIVVLLRFYTRFQVQSVRILADDWMIVVALISIQLAVTAGFALIVVVSGNPSLGRHIWVVPGIEVENMMRILFAFVLLYVLSTPLIKISILLFYRRIFGMTLSIWFPSGGKCVYDLYNFYIAYAGVNVITDISILMVPIPIVWKLQMRRTQKFLVCGILLIGGIVCIASLVRIYYITFIRSHDYTWVIGNVFIWSSIEPAIGILCACLPTLHPLIRSVVTRVFGTSSARYTGSKNKDATNKRTFIRRQRPLDWDETLLTTHDIQVEMSGVRRDHGADGQIVVDMDFRIVEENNQLNTKERPYECNVCHKRFSRSDVLSRHAKGHIQADATAGPSETPNRQPSVIAGASSMIPGSGNSLISTEAQIPPQSTTSRDALTSTGFPSSLDYLADISVHHGRPQSDLGVMTMDDQQQYFGWNAVTAADQVSHRAGLAFDPGPKDMLQMWLEPRTDSGSNDSLDMMRDSHFPLMGDNLMITPDQQNRHSVDSSDDIPNERFARVQQCWLAPPNTGRLINSLWRDIAMSPVDNIFSVRSSHLPSEPSVAQGSRCGFDEDCRRRLQAAFGPMNVSTHMHSPINRNIPPATPTSTLNHSDFPPAEILDMALDLFFRLFNPLLPFVHQPTFSAKKARPSLLYVMTLVGMTLLGTKGTTAFVSRNFSGALDKVTAEFARCSMGLESASGTMTLFATVLLLLNLAGLTGEKAHLEQCQPLYINVMSVAQRHGLFSATEGQILDMTLFETVPDIDVRWKAWSKVESTKRIIIGLLLLDSWYSSFLSTGPITVPDSIQLILPCSESLFCAHSSTQWTHLIRSGERILSSTILAPSENIKVPALEAPADDFYLQAILAIIQLRQSESYHRLLSNRASYPFAPCHTYAMDGRARCLPSLQSQLITNYGETLDRLNPNALITWHNMCMTLTADIQIFDLAAGRAGPAPARKAFDDLREWSQTPAARRACLHAAHIYKVMTNRKASDHPTFQSMCSLFSAGLVLGLYTFMLSDSTSSPSSVGSVELMDDVDWRSVGTEGFTSFMEPRGSQTLAPTDDPAISFIRNGATVYLRGLPLHGGYQSARRIMLDYASLLKDSGKWSVKQFSYILYIMSDVLMDVE
ncbi:Transcription factor, fungi [Penicillium expansum]|nr:Transcription factor, fungi [Penicillium expansum]